MNSTSPTPQDGIALTIIRDFKAPRALVYKMWTDLEHTNRWCWPTGFTILECKADFKVGGAYTTIMRSPDNTDHHVSGVYRVVDQDACLEFTHAWVDPDGNRGHESVVTITFEDTDEEDGDTTRLTLIQSPMESETARDMHQSGWEDTLNNLGPYIATV